ncbi:MAG TPA: hypothetical protein VF990_09820 [Candidatus Dormibacteraeota bacterium]
MRPAIAAAISLMLVACSGQAARQHRPAAMEKTPTANAVAEAGSCGSTMVVQGSIPQWLDDAGGHNNPSGVPYVIAHPELAAGFLFAQPLRAGHPDDPANKILWVVRTPRSGLLTIDGHPLGAATPTVHEILPANSGPGEIYPSYVDAPTAGCWQFDLQWANSHAQVELTYIAS